MNRLVFLILAIIVGVFQIQKEKKTMRFPQVKFQNATKDCSNPELKDWFKELKRLACYPLDYPERKDGLWGPERPSAKKTEEKGHL